MVNAEKDGCANVDVSWNDIASVITCTFSFETSCNDDKLVTVPCIVKFGKCAEILMILKQKTVQLKLVKLFVLEMIILFLVIPVTTRMNLMKKYLILEI